MRLLGTALLIVICSVAAFGSDSLNTFRPWQQGGLDIHHINTTKGNATFIICPDGTTMLIDAGDMDVDAFNEKYYPMTANSTRLSDTTFAAGRFIVDYINKVFPATDPHIDYAIITHYHQDHYGKVKEGTPLAQNGAYMLTGITEVATLLPVTTLIDRGYDFPVDINKYYKDGTFQNYRSFVAHRKKADGRSVQTLIPGSDAQIVLKKDAQAYPQFSVRNVKTNSTFWTGNGNETKTLFTTGELLNDKGKFQENPLSLALKISYGDFDYYTGGDNTGIPDTAHLKHDVETPMADVLGETDVITLNHHGNRDAGNAYFLQKLAPQVVVGQTWCSDHPGQELAFRLLKMAENIDVFLTHLHNEAKAYLGPWVANGFKNTEGHTLIRVAPDGSFNVLILDDTANVVKTFGPYKAR